MRRGSTPTVSCTLPADVSAFSNVSAFFMYNGNVLVTKSLSDMSCDGNVIQFSLSASETSRFPENAKVKFQLKLTSSDGKILLSDIRTIAVRTNLADYA